MHARAPEGSRPRRWRPSLFTGAIAFFALIALVAGTYPMTAAWFSSYEQSQVLKNTVTTSTDPVMLRDEQIDRAHEYNAALIAGVRLEAEANVPTGSGNLRDQALRYSEMLQANADGLMARVRIPKIGVDLPIYHGTSNETLLRGAGHLQGSHLPVGGPGTRAVITAHRGLANATMFTDLDKVEIGDHFTVETLGEPFVYRVKEIEVIAPDDAGSLVAVPGADLVTLVTCTPLGINTQRILVTGERITPTPPDALAVAGAAPTVPGFPWWVLIVGGGLLVVVGYVWRRGFIDAAASAAARI